MVRSRYINGHDAVNASCTCHLHLPTLLFESPTLRADGALGRMSWLGASRTVGRSHGRV